MSRTKEELEKAFRLPEFPRSAKYDVDWTIKHMMGPNVLWLTESLSALMDLKPGMRVLDLGCGTALSSIFLAREFDLQVWATDLWVPASNNWERIREAGLADRVFPIYAESRSLPFAAEFFDAIVSMDAYHYFGPTTCISATTLSGSSSRKGRLGLSSRAWSRSSRPGIPRSISNRIGTGTSRAFTVPTGGAATGRGAA